RAALQDCLVNLCFQSLIEVGGRAERSEKRRGPRQVAFDLCDSRLVRERIDVVRRDIENLVKLSQRFRETTKTLIGNRVLGKYTNVAWVEPLGFVEVTFALIPLALPSCNICEGFRNPAVIGQKRTCLFKVTQRGVVIL